ncbi:MAG: GYD domain-containing protein [Dehalococcoidia bacterium]
MPTYVLLTRLSPEALNRPDAVETLNREVESRIKEQCPNVKWLANYALLGPYDYLDIYEAPDSDSANKVALLVRSLGHATTETWLATSWERFLGQATSLRK